MKKASKSKIMVSNTVQAPVEKVWTLWTTPGDIKKWNTPSHDWHTTRAENDLRPGGKFLSRMEAKDGSFGFDFSGVYDEVLEQKRIAYTLDDGRKAEVDFKAGKNNTEVVTRFEAEDQNPVEMQRDGWQAILNNFKKYAEDH